jgi:glycine/D-amino acid oxidase-like deaminating enzyme
VPDHHAIAARLGDVQMRVRRRAGDHVPMMELDRADVVVVGGGIVGVTTAWFLSELGASVVLLEQRTLASGASGRNLGFLLMQTRNAGYSLEFSRAGRALYDDFAAELGPVFEYQSNGGMIYFTTDAQRRVFTEFAEARREHGIGIEILDEDGVREAAPILAGHAIGATLCKEDGQIRTPRFVRALGDACRRRGVHIHEGVTALGLLRDGDRVAGVRTTWGDVPAGAVVWAGGAWSRTLAEEGVDVPIQLERLGAVLTGPVTEELDKVVYGPLALKQYSLVRDQPSFREEDFSEGSEDRSGGVMHLEAMAKLEDGRLLLGCPMDWPDTIDERMPFLGLKLLIDRFLDVFPHYRSLGIEDTWCGVLPSTADSLPIVGEVPEAPGLFLGTGHVYGNVGGPITGRLLAEMITGAPMTLPVEELSLRRPSLMAGAEIIPW